MAGVTVVALSSLAPMVLPLGLRGLAVTEAISLYGGLAVFSGFVLFEYVYNYFLIVQSRLTSNLVHRRFCTTLAWLKMELFLGTLSRSP